MTKGRHRKDVFPAVEASEAEWSRFGAKFEQLLEEMRDDLIPDCDWMSGACADLAFALKNVIGPAAKLESVICDDGETSHVCHVFVRYGNRVIDGSGIHADTAPLIQTSLDYHAIGEPIPQGYRTYVRDFNTDDLDDVTYNLKVARRLTSALRHLASGHR